MAKSATAPIGPISNLEQIWLLAPVRPIKERENRLTDGRIQTPKMKRFGSLAETTPRICPEDVTRSRELSIEASLALRGKIWPSGVRYSVKVNLIVARSRMSPSPTGTARWMLPE